MSVVNDQIGAPTTAAALAEATHAIVDGIGTDRFGPAERWATVYHMTCAGKTSWHGFAEQIFTRAERLGVLQKAKPKVTPISSSEFPTPAKRPSNSVLSNAKLHAAFGVQLPMWEDALESVLSRLLPTK